MKVVVIGVGNRDRADDGAGPAVAARVLARGGGDIEVVANGGDPTDLIDAWADADAAIVVDALAPRDAPGRVRRFDPIHEPMRSGLFAASSHQFGVAQAVELARALSVLPRRLVVFGIEGRSFTPGGPLCPEVARAVERVADEVLAEVSLVK